MHVVLAWGGRATKWIILLLSNWCLFILYHVTVTEIFRTYFQCYGSYCTCNLVTLALFADLLCVESSRERERERGGVMIGWFVGYLSAVH